jgi:hypothetical protein
MHNIPSLIWNLLSGSPIAPGTKDSAESALSLGELGLVVFAVVVVIGLIAEWYAEKIEKRWIPPKTGFHWPWVAIATWVVIVGILGELFCDADIWVSSDVLQTIFDGEIFALNKEIAPRRLQPNEQDEIVRDLKPLSSGKWIWLSSYALDAEGAVLGSQIVDALGKAGFSTNAELLMSVQGNGSIALAIHITGKDSELVQALLKTIGKYQAVSSEEPFVGGFATIGPLIPVGPPPDASIFVGVKPIQ